MVTATYVITGDMARLRVPSRAATRFRDGLWRHTCCELFVRRVGEASYHELNFSPSGEWAAYAFDRYREGQVALVHVDTDVEAQRHAAKLEVRAEVDLSRVSPYYVQEPLAIGLSAVIEADDGTLSYWALTHPPGKPDFHHQAAFSLTIEAPQ